MSIQRSQTGHLTILDKLPGVSFTFGQTAPSYLYPPSFDLSAAHTVKFTLDPSGQFHTGLHFHVDKGEALRVEQGAIGVQLGSKKLVVTPETGEVIIPRWTVHAWWLHTVPDQELSTDHTIVWERTLPGSREKEAFFRTLGSYLIDLPKGKGPNLFQAFCIFSRWDNYPVLRVWWARGPGGSIVKGFIDAVAQLGIWLGYRGTYPEYLPEDLYRQVAQ